VTGRGLVLGVVAPGQALGRQLVADRLERVGVQAAVAGRDAVGRRVGRDRLGIAGAVVVGAVALARRRRRLAADHRDVVVGARVPDAVVLGQQLALGDQRAVQVRR